MTEVRGATGWISEVRSLLEVCSTELWAVPAREAAQRAADAMRAVLAEAGV